MQTPKPKHLPITLALLVFALNLLFARPASAVVFDGAIDPANLGKGDHIFVLADETNHLEGTVSSVTNLQSLMNYEASLGMQWVAVKASSGSAKYPSDANPQFTYQVVLAGHRAGLQVFGYNRSDGTDPAGEINIAKWIFAQGADGLIMDAETEWESTHLPSLGTPTQIATLATNILKGIKDLYPTKFMGHTPLPVISLHSTFPYQVFGQYCDAVMPQAYWVDFGVTPQSMINNWGSFDMETQWKNWQNGLDVNYHAVSIKPIAPIGQADVLTQPGSDITTFVDTLKGLANPATSGGYKGVSWWRTGLRSAAMLSAIQSANIGGPFPAKPSLPSIPTGLSAASPGGCYVNLTWSSSANANNYIISRSVSNGGPYTDFASTLSTSYTDTNGVNSTTAYYYVVRAANVSGESANSAQASVTTPVPLLPSAPTGFAALNTGCQINLSWTNAANANSYIILRGTASGGPYATTVGSTTNTSYVDTTGNEATTYYYVVRSVNYCGQSGNSSEANATTAAGCVSDIIIDNVNAVFGGAWSAGTSSADKYLTNYNFATTVTGTATRTATYTPTIVTPGYYDVYVWYPQGPTRASDATHIVTYSNGQTTTINVNQTFNGGAWRVLASGMYFLAGTVGKVQINNLSGTAGQNVMADGVRFAWSSKNQRITFPAVAEKAYGDSSFALNATASSGLSVSYTLVSGPATISDNIVTITGVGTITIQADQAGDGFNYFSAPSVSRTIDVLKGTATVSLNGLNQTYDGTARNVTSTTTPGGLTVDLTYNGSPNAPTNAGSYPILATVDDANYQGSAIGTLVIDKATATVTLGSLSQIYNGSARSVTATTSPSGLIVGVTYNGSASAPTNVGSYIVVGTINDANYQGVTTNTLVIDDSTATVTLGNLNQTYDGHARSVTATTSPSGLQVSVTYNGSVNAPTNAGSYTVVGIINDGSYQGATTNTLIVGKGTAAVTLGSLSQTYDGTARSVTSTTTPSGLTVALTYNGSLDLPTNAGSYPVVGTVNDSNYDGSVTNTLVIGKGPATITLGNLSQVFDGNPRSVTATTIPAGLNVTVTYDGSTNAPSAVGNYSVIGTINDTNYAGTVTGTLAIGKPTITGQPVSVSVNLSNATSLTVTAAGGGTLKYQWYFQATPTGAFAAQAGKTNATLAFTNALAMQAGNYYAVVTNIYGKATSAVATVTVVIPPSLVVATVKPKTIVPAGTRMTMYVSAAKGSAGDYQWLFNGSPIGGATDKTNIISGISTNQAGNYSVSISNDAGISTSAPVTIAVSADTNIPTATVKAPVITLSTTNPTGTVVTTGAASDNAQVVGVYYRLNAGAWVSVPFSSKDGNNLSVLWTNTIGLTVGTNILESYSEDWSGNTSKVAKVVCFFNVPMPLTITINEHDTRVGEGSDSAVAPKYTCVKASAMLLQSPNLVPLDTDLYPTNGAQPFVNRGPFTVTAIAGHNQIFTNWAVWQTGGPTNYVPTSKCIFVMQTNLHMEANFIHNPWVEAQGFYDGLATNGPIDAAISGGISLKVGTNLALSGKVFVDGDALSISAAFDTAGSKTIVISRDKLGKPPLTLSLTNLFGSAGSSGTNQIVGTMTDGILTASILADQWIYTKTNYALPGQYTMILPKSTNSSVAPGGYGFSTLTVDGFAKVMAVGSLADGSTLTPQLGYISKDGRWPMYNQMYTAKIRVINYTNSLQFHTNATARGFFLGWMNLTNPAAGTLHWVKDSTSVAPTNIIAGATGVYTNYYTDGFSLDMPVTVRSFVTNSGPLARIINMTNGLISFDGGNMPAPQEQAFFMKTNNTFGLYGYVRVITKETNIVAGHPVVTMTTNFPVQVTTIGTNSALGKLAIALDWKSGKLSGTFTNGISLLPTGVAKPITYVGAVLQPDNVAYGYFLGTNQSGSVTFQADPGNQ